MSNIKNGIATTTYEPPQHVIFTNSDWTVAETARRTVSGLGIKATRTWSRDAGKPRVWHVTVSAADRRRLRRLLDRMARNAS